MDKKYILFDLDGTIIDSFEGVINCVKYAIEQLGHPPVDPNEHSRFIGPPLIESFEAVAKMTPEMAEQAVEKYRERYTDIGIFEGEIYEGIEDTLKRLKDAGKVIILATAKPYDFAKRIIENAGLTKYFDYLYGAELKGDLIHKTAIITYALENSGIEDKSLAIMIGDRSHDIIGARENGIESIGVEFGYPDENELSNAGATYIVDSPKEIADLILDE